MYNLEDALLVGGFINTLLRNSDRLRVACLAQLVNVIAPLVTSENDGLRQSTYYPYSWPLRCARGRVLDLRIESDTYPISREGLQSDFARDDSVPFVDIVATIDGTGQTALLSSIAISTTSARWCCSGKTSCRRACSPARR